MRKTYPKATAEVVDADHVHIGGDMYVRERMCDMFWCENDEGSDGWVCSGCGEWFRHAYGNADPRYCPMCGAKVVV